MANSLLIDGFDTYNSTGNIVGTTTRWTNTGGLTDTTTGTPFSSGQALSFSGSDALGDGLFSAPAASFTIHCHIAWSDYSSGPQFNQIRALSGTTTQFGIGIVSPGELVVYRGTTELGRTTTAAIALNVWYALAIEVVIHDTTGRVTIYLEGVQKLNLTGQDTRNGTPADADRLYLGWPSTSQPTWLIDDLYVHDSATKLTKHPRIVVQRPDSDGATLDFAPSTGTSHFALLDEVPVNNYTDYIDGDTVGDVDEIGIANLASTPDTINAVQVVCFAKKTDSVARQIAGCGVKSGATVSDGSNMVLTITGGRQHRILDTDPATGVAWTEAGVNALILRPKVTL